MKLNARERNFWHRLSGAIAARNTPDLFRELEVQERRKGHLIFVILRKSKQLKIDAPINLECLNESELRSIRFSLSKQIARAKMAAPAEEIAA